MVPSVRPLEFAQSVRVKQDEPGICERFADFVVRPIDRLCELVALSVDGVLPRVSFTFYIISLTEHVRSGITQE